MDDFIIKIIEGPRLLTAVAGSRVLGSQYDSGAQRLFFVRPEKFIDSELILHFTSGGEAKEPINLGKDNEFVVTGDLTGNRELRLQVALVSDGGETIEYTDELRFVFRSSVMSPAPVGTPVNEQLRTLRKNAFAEVAQTESGLLFKNADGENAAVVMINSGGGSYMTPLQKQFAAESAAINTWNIAADTLTLAVITDIHAAAVKDSGALDARTLTRGQTGLAQAAHVSKISTLDGIVILGDILDGGQQDRATKDGAMKLLSQLADSLSERRAPVFPIRGNHDDNSDYKKTTDYVLSPKEWFGGFQRTFEPENGIVHDSQNTASTYYYRDFVQQKIRCIFLDFCDYPWIITSGNNLKYTAGNSQVGWGYGPRQVQWLHSEALDFSGKTDASDWTTLVLMHRQGNSDASQTINNGVIVMEILDAFNLKGTYSGANAAADWAVSVDVDFSGDETQGIIGVLQGHNHKDWTIPPGGEIGATSQLKNPWSYQITAFGAAFRSVNGFSQLVTIDRENNSIFTHSIAEDAALSADYTRSRVVPIPNGEEPAYFQLTQGTHTANGVTVTVSGNRVTMNGTGTASNRLIKISNGLENGSSETDKMTAAWKGQTVFAVLPGDTHTVHMTNVTGTANFPSSLGLIRPYFENGLRVSTISPNPYNGVCEPAGQPVPAGVGRIAFIALALGADTGLPTFTNYSFDVEVFVSGERII